MPLKKLSRIIIYFFYDKDGIIDDYIPNMLSDISKNVEKLLFVSNGKLKKDSREKIQKYADDILERENIGMDVWAYKEGMEYYGWDILKEYDELILMNYTIYGPIYPFKEMFLKMDGNNLDFWGITKHHGFPFDPFGTIPYGYIPEHIQSSFIAIRNKMICSVDFQNYWNNMPMVHNYAESVGKHEAIFTKKFLELGYKGDVYVQTDDLKKDTHYPLMFMPLELVKNRRCPVIKRKSFADDYSEFLYFTVGEPTYELLKYLKEKKLYNLNYIFDNQLRTSNMYDIKNRMQLNYIASQNMSKCKCDTSKIAIIVYLQCNEMFEWCLNYMKDICNKFDLYIITDSAEKKMIICQLLIKLEVNAKDIDIIKYGLEITTFFIKLKNYILRYDFICFVNDFISGDVWPNTIEKSAIYKCFQNLLGSLDLIRNIIEIFKANEKLGMLIPPNHYNIHGAEWGEKKVFQKTKLILDKIYNEKNVDILKPPIFPQKGMFWGRVKTLNYVFNDLSEEIIYNLGNYRNKYIEVAKRVFGFLIQKNRFFIGNIISDEFGKIELTNNEYIIQNMHKEKTMPQRLEEIEKNLKWYKNRVIELEKAIEYHHANDKFLEDKLKENENNLEWSKNRILELEKTDEDKKNEINRLKDEILMMESTFSWRVTKILRSDVIHFIKNNILKLFRRK